MSSDGAPVDNAVGTTFSPQEMEVVRMMIRSFRQAPDIYQPKKPASMTWAAWIELNRKLHGDG